MPATQLQSLLSRLWTGYVGFIEEDHLVSPDFLRVAHLLARKDSSTLCPHSCWGFSLYNHLSRPDSDERHFQQREGFVNAGYFLSLEAWNVLQQLKESFHSCRDGWDMCIMKLQHEGRFSSHFFSPVLSRVQNIGSVGLNMHPGLYKQQKLDQVFLSPSSSPFWTQPFSHCCKKINHAEN